MTKIDTLRNLSEKDLKRISSEYRSITSYLKTELGMASYHSNYASIIKSKLEEFGIVWEKDSGREFKTCPVCDKEFSHKCSKPQTTCSIGCSNTHFRSGKAREAYSNYAGGVDYRTKALRHYGTQCNRCGIKTREVLVVHHIDRNRHNNKIENLEVLCANCHMIEHK